MEVGAVGQEVGAVKHTVSALPSTLQAPGYNPTTPAKVELGRLLFWDPLLSGPEDVACATCHHPQNGYAEDRDLSLGVKGIGLGRFRRQAPGSSIPIVKRNSPTVLNVAFNGIDESGRYDPATAPAFWDNRIRSLESQALEPLKSLEEMRENTYPENEAVARVVKKLQANAEYQSLFAGAFGSEQPVTRKPRQGDSGVHAVAAGQQLAVRPLHARRPQRHDGETGQGNAALRGDRVHQVPQRAHVLRLQNCMSWACPTTPLSPPPTEARRSLLARHLLRSRVLQRPEQRATAMRFARRRCETSNLPSHTSTMALPDAERRRGVL